MRTAKRFRSEWRAVAEPARSYYRHRQDGNLGYLVQRQGRLYVRLDRPGDPAERPFHDAEWIAEEEVRPLTRMQVARVAFEADKMLCISFGLHKEGRAEWMNLRDDDRIAFMQEGPKDPKRSELWSVIIETLRPLTKGD